MALIDSDKKVTNHTNRKVYLASAIYYQKKIFENRVQFPGWLRHDSYEKPPGVRTLALAGQILK
jgi:hypothetical protein